MTTLITADLHFSESTRDRYRLDFQRTLRAEVKKRKVECVVILGDLTEAKDRHSAWLVNQVVDNLHELAKLCPVVIDYGNHDYADEEWPFFAFLDRLDNVTWVREPGELDAGYPDEVASDLGRVLFLPHTNNYKRDWKAFDFTDYDTIFAHNTFEGANKGFGKVLHGIPLDVFPADAFVLAGDIHVPQTLGPVTYVGAPYLVDFGDNYKPRMLLLNRDKTLSIPCKGPQKRLVEITKMADLEKAEVNEGDILRVRVRLEEASGEAWMTIHGKIKQWGEKAGVTVDNVQPITQKMWKPSSDRKSRAKARKSDEQLVEEFSKRRGLDRYTAKAGAKLLRDDR